MITQAEKIGRAGEGRRDGGFAVLSAARIVVAMAVALTGLIAFSALGSSPLHAETRTLSMYYTHTKESIKVTFKKNGRYDKRGLKKLNRFLRDFRRNEPTKMDPALFDLVWEVYKKSGSRKKIHVISGYRSPKTNNMLRRRGRNVAKTSQHTKGKALDFFLPDVSVDKLRALGLKAHRGGVGYYRGSFVHLDTGRVRHWPRMSARQLAKVFPRGKTIHVPSNGKQLRGYKTAMANLKAGKNADGSRRGSSVKPSLLARLFTRSGNDGDENEGNVAPQPKRKPVKKAPAKKPAPKAVAVAKAKPVTLPKAKSGPNVFASESDAQLNAKLASDARKALAAKNAADAAAAEKVVEERTPETEIAALLPSRVPVPRGRPAQATLTALAPAAPAVTESPTQLALATPDVVPVPESFLETPEAPSAAPAAQTTPKTRVLRPRGVIPESPASLSNEQTASVPERVLEPVVEIESIAASQPVENSDEPSLSVEDGGSAIAGIVPSSRPNANGDGTSTVSTQALASLSEDVASTIAPSSRSNETDAAFDTLSSPSRRPTEAAAGAGQEEAATAALVAVLKASAAIENPTSPHWRDEADQAPKAPIVVASVPAVASDRPSSTAQPVAAIAVSGGVKLEPALSIGDLDSSAVKVWAIAASTRTGSAAQLRAPDYSQGTRRATPASVYSEGFEPGRAPWRSDRFSGVKPLRVAFINLGG